jgi:hypothetical protein
MDETEVVYINKPGVETPGAPKLTAYMRKIYFNMMP